MFKLLNALINPLYYIFFKINLMIAAISARLGWDKFTGMFMRLNARFVLLIRKAEYKSEISEIGNEWRRMFPYQNMQEVLSVTGNTFYAKTRTWCPLRGTGDVRACYKVMEFDRTMVQKIGGQFIVLSSQAQPGETTCRIAIRKPGESVDDLIPAHHHIL